MDNLREHTLGHDTVHTIVAFMPPVEPFGFLSPFVTWLLDLLMAPPLLAKGRQALFALA